MKAEVSEMVEVAARKMYKHHALVNAFILSQKLAISLDIVRDSLVELGYSEHASNLFVLRSKKS